MEYVKYLKLRSRKNAVINPSHFKHINLEDFKPVRAHVKREGNKLAKNMQRIRYDLIQFKKRQNQLFTSVIHQPKSYLESYQPMTVTERLLINPPLVFHESDKAMLSMKTQVEGIKTKLEILQKKKFLDESLEKLLTFLSKEEVKSESEAK